MDMRLNLAGELYDSLSNGEGIRYVIFLQGCHHRCVGCHNKSTWPDKINRLYSVNELMTKIKDMPFIDGVTFSGGEPFDQAPALIELATRIKEETNLNIWCYTGYTYEELKHIGVFRSMEATHKSKLLRLIDVLVDGRFQKNNTEGASKYTGSANQRVLRLVDGKIAEIID